MSHGVHVLLVDDEYEFRTAMAALLASEGFRVSTAGSGDEALRFVQETPDDPVDVFLLDFRMPGRDGGQTLQELRKRGIRSCAILLSAITNAALFAGKLGFDAGVAKPCHFDELLDAIHRCTSSRCVTPSPGKSEASALSS